jgi:hypothetical protein
MEQILALVVVKKALVLQQKLLQEARAIKIFFS